MIGITKEDPWDFVLDAEAIVVAAESQYMTLLLDVARSATEHEMRCGCNSCLLSALGVQERLGLLIDEEIARILPSDTI